MRAKVVIRLKSGVLDVQGKTVEQSLKSLGEEKVSNVRIGKLVEFDVKELNQDKARATVEELCRKLFANPVIEDFEIEEIG